MERPGTCDAGLELQLPVERFQTKVNTSLTRNTRSARNARYSITA